MTVVTANGDAETVELAATPFETLSEWCEYTRSARGWDIGLHVGESLVDDLIDQVVRPPVFVASSSARVEGSI
nr:MULTISPECIES: hypothetical protein [unclassified Haloarcula]